MHKPKRLDRVIAIILTTAIILGLTLGLPCFGAYGGVMLRETETVEETVPPVTIEETTEAETDVIETEEYFEETAKYFEEDEEDFGYVDEEYEIEEETEELTDEETEEYPTYTEHECNSFIQIGEEDGCEVVQCEECGETEYWDCTPIEDVDEECECLELSEVDEEGYAYCLECGAGYYQE